MDFLAVGIGAGAVVVLAAVGSWVLVSVLVEIRDDELDASEGDGWG